ncbi:MAG: nucleotidyltransferase family protein [Rhodospirillales bacterium]|nr:nucleotidyltransferase family protein [Rhodospirillales bacterium]
MDKVATLQMLMTVDPLRREALEVVAALDLPDCWIGAGFVRDALWDHLHGYGVTEPRGDIDVVWHSAVSPQVDFDEAIEQKLRAQMPALQWSVKNQARMHFRNDDAPYDSVSDAMRNWPETATAVAVRLDCHGAVEVSAPLGLDDLFALKLRPTPRFLTEKLPIFFDRIASKHWIERYPRLTLEAPTIECALG